MRSNEQTGEAARGSIGTAREPTGPITINDPISGDSLQAEQPQGLVAISDAPKFSEATRGTNSTVAAREPFLNEPDKASAPTAQAKMEVSSPVSAESRISLKDIDVQHSNHRSARSAGRVEAPSELVNERKSVAHVTQEWTNTAEPRSQSRDVTAAVNGPVEQHAYNSIDSARPSLNGGNGQARSDMFATLDADQTLHSATWIHAGAHHAEAGYLDPVLGWVGVRADANHNGIHATVVPGSLEAAEVIGGHLSGLNAHLALNHENTATVTLASLQDGRGSAEWDSQTATGDRGAQHHDGDGGTRANETGMAESLGSEQATIGQSGLAATTVSPVPRRSGSYISVIA